MGNNKYWSIHSELQTQKVRFLFASKVIIMKYNISKGRVYKVFRIYGLPKQITVLTMEVHLDLCEQFQRFY